MTLNYDNERQTIRIFDQEEGAAPISCGFLKLADGGKIFDFHLVRVRSRIVRRRESPRELNSNSHHHTVFHLILVTGGKGIFSYNGKHVPCQLGDLLCISPNEDHHIAPQTTNQVQFIAVTFFLRARCGADYAAPFSQYLRRLTGIEVRPMVEQPITLPPPIFNRVQDQLEHLLDLLLLPAPAAIEFHAAHLLVSFFGTVATELAAASEKDTPLGNDPRLERIRGHIENHFAEKLTIANLAARAAMSPGHLQRQFKQAYNSSPIAYQQQLRIERAKRMLRDTDWPIAAIAERVGYLNVYYFSTVFKQATGTPPGHYRKSTRD